MAAVNGLQSQWHRQRQLKTISVFPGAFDGDKTGVRTYRDRRTIYPNCRPASLLLLGPGRNPQSQVEVRASVCTKIDPDISFSWIIAALRQRKLRAIFCCPLQC